ncbi:MAG: alpha/beta fold hydrolase [Propionibacteriaceae bacterium]
MRRLGLVWLTLGVLLGAACSPTTDSSGPPPAPRTTSGPPSTPAPPPRPSPTATPTLAPSPRPSTPKPSPSKKPDPVSVQALIEKDYDGRDLDVGRLLDDAGPYKRYLVTYRSEDLKISGVMNVPDGKGPFPVLVLAHGYIDPDSYQPGQGMRREQDYLARQGYVVLHTDYRGHATSDNDKNVDYELRLPYAVDVINAVLAVKESKLDYLDGDRVGLFGRSMGGNVVLNALVAKPGLVDAAVVYASTSSLAADNWKQFYNDDGERAAVNRRIDRTYGLPEDSPAFWKAASPRSYFDRVTEPIQLHHGTADDTCPIEWSEATLEALEDADRDAKLFRYSGEGHTFYSEWSKSIRRTTDFFDEEL